MHAWRRWLGLAALLTTFVAGGAAAQSGPIKIGFLSPISGAIAAAGKDMYAGCDLYWKESKSFEDNGGHIIQKLWVPLNVQDYAPYVTQVKRDADAVFVVGLGRWTRLFAQAWAASPLYRKVALLANGTYSDEHALPQLGDESIGVISAHHYSAALDTPANRKFRAAYEKEYQRTPGFDGENRYTGARFVSEAVKSVGGKVEDRPALMAALRRVKIADAPRGPVEIDAWGNPTQNIYIRKVARVGGKLQNTVIQTIPRVGQFWKYNPEEFLKQPVYSRDFPPCKHC